MRGASARKALKKYLSKDPVALQVYKDILKKHLIQSIMISMVVAATLSVIPGMIYDSTLFVAFFVFSAVFVFLAILLYVFILKAELDHVFFWLAVERKLIPINIAVRVAKKIRARAAWNPVSALVTFFVKL